MTIIIECNNEDSTYCDHRGHKHVPLQPGQDARDEFEVRLDLALLNFRRLLLLNKNTCAIGR